MFIYNIGIKIYWALANVLALHNPKIRQWVEGRKSLWERMESEIKDAPKLIWMHVASLGEFEQGRTLLEELHTKFPEHKILVTSFSPSGMAIKRVYKDIDYLFELPLDTTRNAKRFLEITKPDMVFFVKYEYWFNFLRELKRQSIDTYIISANFRLDSIFFKPWGYLYRRALTTFKQIFVQTDSSKKLLQSIGVENVVTAGDTRFDRVCEIAKNGAPVDFVEQFKGDKQLLVAGSTWSADTKILLPVISQNPDLKVIITPHEVEAKNISRLKKSLSKAGIKSICITEAEQFQEVQVVIIDKIGLLSRLYRYATFAYIGGGFGVGIHNTLEAAVFGTPIWFGRKFEKFVEATEMVELGVAQSITSSKQMTQGLNALSTNPELYAKIRGVANSYIEQKRGATHIIMEHIQGEK